MKQNKKRNYKYAWGGEIDPNVFGQISTMGGNILGQAAGGTNTDFGGFLSGAGSGAGLGASIGSVIPGVGTAIGGIAGGLIGGIGGLFGANAKQEAAKRAAELARKNKQINYNKTVMGTTDTSNDNPYGNLIFANGGVVPFEQINIEEGELQIDPVTGKILRKYIGKNPENGELYKPHSKGKDPKGNFVTAEPGTFIITKKLAKEYEDSIDNNDRIHRDTILQNIKNTKESKDKTAKMAFGSFVDPTKPPYLSAMNPQWSADSILRSAAGLSGIGTPQIPISTPNVTGNFTSNINPITTGTSGGEGNDSTLGKVAGALSNYGPALLNIGQGLFGKVEQTPNVNPISNPYTNQVLGNMPEEISLNPLVNRINRNQTTQFKQIDNTTSGNPIARANKNNVFANTQNNLADVYMQQEQANNQIKSQRGTIYNNLGQQRVQEEARAQQINLGINEGNVANRAAKQNLLGTGLSQLQQVFQNQRLNKNKQNMDKYKVDLLKQMFPNLKYYGSQFGEDAIAQLMGG